MPAAQALGNVARVQVARNRVFHQRHLAIHHRDVDEGAFAAAVPAFDRRQDRHRGEQAGSDVADRDAHAGRRAAFLAGDAHHAGYGLGNHVEGGFVAIRAGLAIAGDRGVDQARVQCLGIVIPQAQPVHDAGPVVLDQDVAASDQVAQDLLAFLGFQIDRDAALVAVDAHEIQAFTAVKGRDGAGEVTFARPLDLMTSAPSSPSSHVQ